jgi:hypothetical protein
MSFRAIGAALDISPTTARKLILGALEDVKHEAADIMRTLEGERLNELQSAYWDSAVGGDVNAARVILRIMETRAKLFGLNAPTVVQTEIYSGADIDAEVARIERLALAGRSDAEPNENRGGTGGVVNG